MSLTSPRVGQSTQIALAVGLLAALWPCAGSNPVRAQTSPSPPTQSSPARVYIATRDPNALVVVESATGEQLAPIALPGEPSALAVAPDGGRAYVGVPGGVAVVDVAAAHVVGMLDPGWQAKVLALVPGGARLVAVADDELAEPSDGGRLAVFDLATGTILGTTKLRSLAGALAVTADGRRAVIGHHFYSGILTVVGLDGAQVEGEMPLADGVAAVVAAPDGRVLALSGSNGGGRLTAVDPQSRSVIAEQEVGDDPTHVALAPDASRAWIADFRGGAVTALDATSLAVGDRVPVADYPVRLAVAPDGRSVYVLHNGEHEVTRIDVASAAKLGTLTLAGEPVAIAVPAPAALADTPEEGGTDEGFPIWAWLMVDGIVLALLARHLRNYRARQRRDGAGP
jgi:DNA-binding beta-propeller fold protein YncE